MKIYVSFEQTGADSVEKMASGSLTKLLNKLRKQGGEFTVALFDVKPNVDNICKLIVDVTELEAEWVREYVAADGRLREVKDAEEEE